MNLIVVHTRWGNFAVHKNWIEPNFSRILSRATTNRDGRRGKWLWNADDETWFYEDHPDD